MNFKDNFSTQAKDYARYRPNYPQALYTYILELVGKKGTLWDCATGNGQVATQLAPHFEKVWATDASEAQIQEAIPFPNVSYQVATAHQTNLPTHSTDLITVAQALHWFAHEDFYQEVRRIGKPHSHFIAWGYGLCSIMPDIDVVVKELYTDILGKYWDSERHYIDAHYDTLPFPFTPLPTPSFEITIEYDLPTFKAYLSTWSSWQKYIKAHQKSPISMLETSLDAAWGSAQEVRLISFPLFVKATRLP